MSVGESAAAAERSGARRMGWVMGRCISWRMAVILATVSWYWVSGSRWRDWDMNVMKGCLALLISCAWTSLSRRALVVFIQSLISSIAGESSGSALVAARRGLVEVEEGTGEGGALGPRDCRLSFNKREGAIVLFLLLDVIGRLARGAGRGLGCWRLAGYRSLCEGYASKWLTFPGLHLLVQEGTVPLDEYFSVYQIRCNLTSWREAYCRGPGLTSTMS